MQIFIFTFIFHMYANIHIPYFTIMSVHANIHIHIHIPCEYSCSIFQNSIPYAKFTLLQFFFIFRQILFLHFHLKDLICCWFYITSIPCYISTWRVSYFVAAKQFLSFSLAVSFEKHSGGAAATTNELLPVLTFCFKYSNV